MLPQTHAVRNTSSDMHLVRIDSNSLAARGSSTTHLEDGQSITEHPQIPAGALVASHSTESMSTALSGLVETTLDPSASTATHPPELEPPSYESIHPLTPIVIDFWRFSFVYIDRKAKKRYVGRRVELKSDICLITPATSWEEFALAQVTRSIQLFGWASATRFAFSMVLKVNNRECLADPENWPAMRELLLLKEERVELFFSVCPSTASKPHALKMAGVMVRTAARRLGAFVHLK